MHLCIHYYLAGLFLLPIQDVLLELRLLILMNLEYYFIYQDMMKIWVQAQAYLQGLLVEYLESITNYTIEAYQQNNQVERYSANSPHHPIKHRPLNGKYHCITYGNADFC